MSRQAAPRAECRSGLGSEPGQTWTKTTLSLHTRAVLIAFGAWALASALLRLIRAWRADRSRRVQLPLIISGGISAIAGAPFAAMASQHVAPLSDLRRYAVLGAVFFAVRTVIDRTSRRPG